MKRRIGSGRFIKWRVRLEPWQVAVTLGCQFLRGICGPCTCRAQQCEEARSVRKPGQRVCRSGFTDLVFSLGPCFLLLPGKRHRAKRKEQSQGSYVVA